MSYGDLITEVKNRLSIIDLAQEFQRVQKAGKYYKGLCPFHNERTASFVLYPDSNRYYCFGCHAKGSSIDLYAHYHNIDFKTAMGQLSKRYGLINITDLQQKKLRQQRKQMTVFIEKKRKDLLLLLYDYRNTLNKFLSDVTGDFTSENLTCIEKYGGLYHELSKIDYFIYVIDTLRVNEVTELKILYEKIPKYLLYEIYYPYFHEESEETTDEEFTGGIFTR